MKLKLFTHTDLDGVGCYIALAAYIKYYNFENDITLDTSFCNYGGEDGIDKIFKAYIDSGAYQLHDHIIMSDITLKDQNLIDFIDKNLSDKFSLLDHHQSAVDLYKPYSWATITPDKACGTSLVFNWITSDSPETGYIEHISEFIEAVRQYDTWEWEKLGNEVPKHLNSLLGFLGQEFFSKMYIDLYGSIYSKPTLITNEGAAYLEILNRKEEEIIQNAVSIAKGPVTWNAHSMIVTTAASKISLIGNRLSELNPDVDIIAIVDFSKQAVSFRSRKKGVDLGAIAKLFGGGGHAKAAGIPFQSMDSELKEFFVLNLI